jgi:hypothetical protein
MADTKISALSAASTPLAGTEVLPIVQSGATVKVAVSDLTNGRNVLASNLGVGGAVVSGYRVSAYGPYYSSTGTSNFLGEVAVGLNAGAYKLDVLGAAGVQTIFRAGQSGVSNGFTVSSDGTNLAYTFDSGNIVIGTSGKGIDFSATPGTGTSELLADYEEGTWTPTVTPAAGSFTTVTAGTCEYTKVGRIVTVNARFTLTNSGTGTGAMTINGLPFTIASTYDQNTFSGRIVNSGTPIFGQLVATTTSVDSFQTIAGTTAISNGFIYTFTATYIA